MDLVYVRYDEQVSVMFGHCAHRSALMSDGSIDGNNLICGVHGWGYLYSTGVSEYNSSERLHKFSS
jgi:nitrite reductase/ring-hydroxylating ferredoxin subunit